MLTTTACFPDRLAEVVRRYGPLCVGLDPRWESLPSSFRVPEATIEEKAKAYELFCVKVMELVRPYAGVIKPQAAFFEQLGPAGFMALQAVQKAARDLGFLTILDAKRGDIASTATAYAEAAFAPNVWHADAITVNPFLGADAIEPFVQEANRYQGGLFVLVRTSNPGSGLFQNLTCEGQAVYRHVAEAVAGWNQASVNLSQCGYGSIGAVVGATHPRELAELRAMLPNVWFLVPGYGAQGGTADALKPAFCGEGLGAVVNSSRGILFPYEPNAIAWEQNIRSAAERSQAELLAVSVR